MPLTYRSYHWSVVKQCFGPVRGAKFWLGIVLPVVAFFGSSWFPGAILDLWTKRASSVVFIGVFLFSFLKANYSNIAKLNGALSERYHALTAFAAALRALGAVPYHSGSRIDFDAFRVGEAEALDRFESLKRHLLPHELNRLQSLVPSPAEPRHYNPVAVAQKVRENANSWPHILQRVDAMLDEQAAAERPRRLVTG